MPSKNLPDVAQFETTVLPFVCVFFEFSKEARVVNISPLLSIEGVTTASWGIDLLHSWHLGPEASYVGHVLYFLLRIGIYTRDSPAFLADEDLMATGLNQLKADVWRYYRKRQRGDSSGDWKRRGSTI